MGLEQIFMYIINTHSKPWTRNVENVSVFINLITFHSRHEKLAPSHEMAKNLILF